MTNSAQTITCIRIYEKIIHSRQAVIIEKKNKALKVNIFYLSSLNSHKFNLFERSIFLKFYRML